MEFLFSVAPTTSSAVAVCGEERVFYLYNFYREKCENWVYCGGYSTKEAYRDMGVRREARKEASRGWIILSSNFDLES